MSQQSKVTQQVVQNLKRKLVETKPKGTAALRESAAYKILKGTLANASGMITATEAMCFNLKLNYRSHKLDKTPVWWKVPPRHRRKDSPGTCKGIFPQQANAMQKRCNPSKKDGTWIVTEKHIMTMTLSEAFEDYRTEHPQDKVKLTSLKKTTTRKCTQIFRKKNRRTCLCTSCSNAALKLEAIRKYASHGDEHKENLHTLAQLKKTALSDASRCDDELHPHQKCLDRACGACKTKLDALLEPLGDIPKMTSPGTSGHMSSYLMKSVACHVLKKRNSGWNSKRPKEDMKPLPGHLFRTAWQQCQMTLCKEKLDEGDVAFCMDFVEN